MLGSSDTKFGVLFGGARSRIANDWRTGRRHQRCNASRHQLALDVK